MNKNDYRNILVAVSGLTPQIITETLYALVVEQRIPIHKIFILTTYVGKEKIEKLLLNSGLGKIYQFSREYGLRAEDYIPEIHLIEQNGKPLNDIRTDDHNKLAADKIVEIVRRLTQDKNTRIFASVAGGRKTMSVYLGFAMQLFGRKQDVLTHVLVHPEIVESNPGFFYIPKHENPLKLQKKNPDGSFTEFEIPISKLKIELAEIPFIRLRELIPQGYWEKYQSFMEIVEIAQRELEDAQFQPVIEVNLKEATVIVKDRGIEHRVRLKPQEMAFYYYICAHEEFINQKDINKEIKEELVKIYEAYYPHYRIGTASFHKDALQSLRSRINKGFEKQVANPRILPLINISSKRIPQGVLYSIPLKQNRIKLIPSLSKI